MIASIIYLQLYMYTYMHVHVPVHVIIMSSIYDYNNCKE